MIEWLTLSSIVVLISQVHYANPVQTMDTTTLLIVSSKVGVVSENEFIILKSSGDRIEWSVVGPEGKILANGNDPGSSKNLAIAFKKALSEKKDGRSIEEKDKPKESPYFSLLLIHGTDVQACPLSSIQQQLNFIKGDDLQAVFNQVRKKVYGKRYSMPILLRVGNEGLKDELPIKPRKAQTNMDERTKEKVVPGPVSSGTNSPQSQNQSTKQ